MTMDRRQFVIAAALAAGVTAIPAVVRANVLPAERKLRILILGGTGFLGPHTVDYAVARGHEVTLFNRGRTNKNLFPELETIIGNRDPDVDQGLSGLEGREWDAVIDNSGFVPRMTGASSNLLSDRVEHYVFVSTICQYDGWLEGENFRTEAVPRATLEDPTTEDVRTHYCALKAYAEMAVEEAMPGRVTQIRPGLIVGPRDATDRFTYWPVRAGRGGEMLAPGKPADMTQYIDVRDLSRFMVQCAEQKLAAPFNVVREAMPMGAFLDACVRETGSRAELTWVAADFLAENDLQSWRDLQMWADSASPRAGSLTWSPQSALEAGLTIRPVEETIRDTIAWFETLPAERQQDLKSGISAEKESAVLRAWHASKA